MTRIMMTLTMVVMVICPLPLSLGFGIQRYSSHHGGTSPTTTTITITGLRKKMCLQQRRIQTSSPHHRHYGFKSCTIMTAHTVESSSDEEGQNHDGDSTTTTTISTSTTTTPTTTKTPFSSTSNSNITSNTVRYRCRVAYHGGGFSGFQLQQSGVGGTSSRTRSRGAGGPAAAANRNNRKEDPNDSNTNSGEGRSNTNSHQYDNKDTTATITTTTATKMVITKRTVQGVLEQVLQQRFSRIIRVVGAGRTDAGVHARGQAIHFDLSMEEHYQLLSNDSKKKNNDHNDNEQEGEEDDSQSSGRDPKRHITSSSSFETTLNRMLPPDVRVWNVGPAPDPCEEENIVSLKKKNTMTIDGRNETSASTTTTTPTTVYPWNVMRKSTSKLYSYRLCFADAMDPLFRHDRWQLDSNWIRSVPITTTTTTTGPDTMDIESLRTILQQYVGTHDFICFAGALEANEKKTGIKMSTIRTIHRSDLICENEIQKLYRIDIYLDGALYKMVRNIVGTAIDVWRNALSQESFQRLLMEPTTYGLSRNDNICKPAPAHGLTLERVFYDDDDEEEGEDFF